MFDLAPEDWLDAPDLSEMLADTSSQGGDLLQALHGTVWPPGQDDMPEQQQQELQTQQDPSPPHPSLLTGNGSGQQQQAPPTSLSTATSVDAVQLAQLQAALQAHLDPSVPPPSLPIGDGTGQQQMAPTSLPVEMVTDANKQAQLDLQSKNQSQVQGGVGGIGGAAVGGAGGQGLSQLGLNAAGAGGFDRRVGGALQSGLLLRHQAGLQQSGPSVPPPGPPIGDGTRPQPPPPTAQPTIVVLDAGQQAAQLAQQQAEQLAKQQAEQLEKQQAEQLEKQQAAQLAQQQAEQLAKQQAEQLEKQQAEQLEKQQAAQLAQQQAEQLEKQQAEQLEKQQAAQLAQQQAEQLAKQQAEQLAKQQAEQLEKQQAEQLEKQQAEQLEKQQAAQLEKQQAEQLEKQQAAQLAQQQAAQLAQQQQAQMAHHFIWNQSQPQGGFSGIGSSAMGGAGGQGHSQGLAQHGLGAAGTWGVGGALHGGPPMQHQAGLQQFGSPVPQPSLPTGHGTVPQPAVPSSQPPGAALDAGQQAALQAAQQQAALQAQMDLLVKSQTAFQGGIGGIGSAAMGGAGHSQGLTQHGLGAAGAMGAGGALHGGPPMHHHAGPHLSGPSVPPPSLPTGHGTVPQPAVPSSQPPGIVLDAERLAALQAAQQQLAQQQAALQAQMFLLAKPQTQSQGDFGGIGSAAIGGAGHSQGLTQHGPGAAAAGYLDRTVGGAVRGGPPMQHQGMAGAQLLFAGAQGSAGGTQGQRQGMPTLQVCSADLASTTSSSDCVDMCLMLRSSCSVTCLLLHPAKSYQKCRSTHSSKFFAVCILGRTRRGVWRAWRGLRTRFRRNSAAAVARNSSVAPSAARPRRRCATALVRRGQVLIRGPAAWAAAGSIRSRPMRWRNRVRRAVLRQQLVCVHHRPGGQHRLPLHAKACHPCHALLCSSVRSTV